MRLWKVLGLAGVAGVAATGVVIARGERRRRAYGPDDVRARLHQRHAEAVQAEATPPTERGDRPGDRAPGCLQRPWGMPRLSVLRRRRR